MSEKESSKLGAPFEPEGVKKITPESGNVVQVNQNQMQKMLAEQEAKAEAKRAKRLEMLKADGIDGPKTIKFVRIEDHYYHIGDSIDWPSPEVAPESYVDDQPGGNAIVEDINLSSDGFIVIRIRAEDVQFNGRAGQLIFSSSTPGTKIFYSWPKLKELPANVVSEGNKVRHIKVLEASDVEMTPDEAEEQSEELQESITAMDRFAIIEPLVLDKEGVLSPEEKVLFERAMTNVHIPSDRKVRIKRVLDMSAQNYQKHGGKPRQPGGKVVRVKA